MHMLHKAPLLLFLIWTGFTVIGLDCDLFGPEHWFGALVIGTFWCLFAMIKGIFD